MAKKDRVSETPATALLRAQGVAFTEHPYEYLEHGGAQHSAEVLAGLAVAMVGMAVLSFSAARVCWVLALAALQVWRQPLPEILREKIMEPIGASNTWRWYGYDNSWIVLDGKMVQSVSGGGHWGGGMFINAWDLARFGYLFLRDGEWRGKQIVSKAPVVKQAAGAVLDLSGGGSLYAYEFTPGPGGSSCRQIVKRFQML